MGLVSAHYNAHTHTHCYYYWTAPRTISCLIMLHELPVNARELGGRGARFIMQRERVFKFGAQLWHS